MGRGIRVLEESLVVSSGAIFAISARTGDIEAGTLQGLYAEDTRFLSAYVLTLNRRRPSPLGASSFDNALASFYQSSAPTHNLSSGTVSVTRDRHLSHGLHEDVALVNHGARAVAVRLELTFDSDFADVFDVRLGHTRRRGRTRVENREGQHLCLAYRRGHFHRETWVSLGSDPIMYGKQARFDVTLRPKETWRTCVSVIPVLEEDPPPVACVQGVLGPPFGAYRGEERAALLPSLKRRGTGEPLDDIPRLDTDHPGLMRAYEQAVVDLRSLRIEHEPGHHILAAGLPWFMAVFGRDSIISSIQSKLLGPELMVGTLHTLAALQARERDDFRDAQPGKIPHEVRKGELSVLEEVPHTRYYGSVDVTPLFLVLLSEAYQWTGDAELLRRFLPAAEAALRWIDRHGDLDGDGFVEYRRRARRGLRNQGWKDSEDAVSFASGALAEGPIALIEVQGYVYDAKRRMAAAYRTLGHPNKARRLERQAERLREQVDQAFWMPNEGYYALALDGRKRQVDAITSNPGHCLWSGMLDERKARLVCDRLAAPDMSSGWGVRTLSTEMGRYSPVSYHNGSVWPHDNSLIAAGMARYGFVKEANLIAMANIDAAQAFAGHRLPELFSGYPRREYSFPVPYPAANAPQAWASGALVYLLETILGVVPVGDRLLQEAPREGMAVSLAGVRYRGSRRVL